jgi:8-oxo-dGTP diphosphatase/2-hydroxy-dATP diphosphatase
MIQTLCLVRRGDDLLLAMKKRGFGAGRWNGLGGKLAPGESVETAMRRECREEANINIGAAERVGCLTFSLRGRPEPLEVHVFRADSYAGEPTETEEMRPQWFPASELPFDDMWPDDRHWMAFFLAGKRFAGSFSFAEDGSVAGFELREAELVSG